jgi:hypothetical protein
MSGRTERSRTGPRVRAIYLVEAGYAVAGAACIEAQMMADGADGNAESPESRFSDLAERDDAFTVIARNQPVLASRGNMPNSKCHHHTLTLPSTMPPTKWMTFLQQVSFPMKLPCDILRYTPDLLGETLLSSMQTDCTDIASTNSRTLFRNAVYIAAKGRSTHLRICVLSIYIRAL